jgi:hypothetical protein
MEFFHPFEGLHSGKVVPAPGKAPDRVLSSGRSADTEELLGLLDKNRRHRGSTELFDALLLEKPEAVSLALSRVPSHPLRQELLVWLERREASLPALPSAQELILSELEERVSAQDRQIRELKARVEALGGLGLNGQRIAEMYAGACVVLAGVAILGWMAAFGMLPFSPEAPAPVLAPELPEAPAINYNR